MVIARVRRRLEAETPLDLQTRMAAEVADIPERVGLALEQRDDDGPARSEGEQGPLEELDEEFLVVANLTVYVC